MRFQWFLGRSRGRSFVIVVDYTTNFFDIQRIPNCESQTVIIYLKSTFAKFGIPYIVMSDNGPEYSSLLFKAFAQEWDFDNATSSPNYPQCNGLIERTIQTVKRCVKKALDANEDPYLSLLSLRITPGMDGMSPSYKMLGRTIRNNMPYQKTHPSIKVLEDNNKNLRKHGDSSRELTSLNTGDVVRIRSKEDWKDRGVVVGKECPRSYIVQNERGSKLRRNRRHLIKFNEDVKEITSDEPDIILSESGNDVNYFPEESTDGSDDQDVQNVVDAADNVTEKGTDMSSERTTRSGRISRKPDRYKDYVSR